MWRTIYLLTAYDGTAFHGWQQQPGLRTVQGVVEESLRRVVRHPVELIGSGRTDAGVHAAGHVSSFRTTCPLDTTRFRHAIGSRLPEDLSIVTVRDVHPAFNARHHATGKLYVYRIHNSRSRPVEQSTERQVYHVWHRLDLERMRQAARHLVGTKDFAAFCAKVTDGLNTIRTVLGCDVDRHKSEVRVEVEGSGFLYNQVRIMVGTLLNVGRGLWEPEQVNEALATRDRRTAGPTAPAKGLCLRWVRYPPELLRVPEEAGDAGRDLGSVHV